MEPRIEPPTDEDVASFESEEPTEVMPERPPMSTPGEPPAPAPARSQPGAKAAPAAPPAAPAAVAKPVVAEEDDAESKDRAYVAPRAIPRAAVPEAPAAQPRIVLNVEVVAPPARAEEDKAREQRRRRAPTVKIERGTLAARSEADAIATLPEGIPAPLPPPAFAALEPRPAIPADPVEPSLDVDVELDAPPRRASRGPWIVAGLALAAALGALALFLGPRLVSGPAPEAREGALEKPPAGDAKPIETSIAEAAPAPPPSATPEPVEQPANEPEPSASAEAAVQAPSELPTPAATATAPPRPVAPTSTYRPSRPAPTTKKSDVPREI